MAQPSDTLYKIASDAIHNDSVLQQWFRVNHIPAIGIGIIKEGRLQQIRVMGEIRKGITAPYNTIFNVASLTKPVTAMVTLILISKKKWNLDEPLFHYWIDPDISADPRSRVITTRHVLSHQTGFPNWRFNSAGKKLAFEFDPGAKYQYSGEGFEYLRKALEKKFGKTLDQMAKELIFQPLKMSDTRFFWDSNMNEERFASWYDANGNTYEIYKNKKANAADDLLTTVSDYGNFLVAVMNGYQLTDSVFTEFTSHQVKTKENKFFGLGAEIYDLGNGEYALSHGGADKGVQTLFFLLPKSRQGLIIFTNVDDGYKVYEPLIKAFLGYRGQRIVDIEMKN